jgi:hypothetical protein
MLSRHSVTELHLHLPSNLFLLNSISTVTIYLRKLWYSYIKKTRSPKEGIIPQTKKISNMFSFCYCYRLNQVQCIWQASTLPLGTFRIPSYFFSLFIYSYVYTLFGSFLPSTLTPFLYPTIFTCRQNLFCPFLQFCWREDISNNKKDKAFLLVEIRIAIQRDY